MEQEDTRGPWVAKKITTNCHREIRSYRVTTDGEYEVAQCRGEYVANLIAGAPDLLEALEEAIEHTLKTIWSRTPGTRFPSWVDKAQAAIAKARGEN